LICNNRIEWHLTSTRGCNFLNSDVILLLIAAANEWEVNNWNANVILLQMNEKLTIGM
jgi:hypothetical protein